MTKKAYDDFVASGRSDPDLHDQGELYQRTTNALWGVCAGVAVTAVILAIFTRWRRAESSSPVSAGPLVGPGGVGLTITWK